MRIAKYFVVGGISALSDLVVFSIGVYLLHWPYLLCGLIGFVISTALNYVLSVRFVFVSGVRFGRYTEVFLVFLVSSVGLLINLLVLYFAIESAGIEPFLAKIIATGTVFVWNYTARAHFVFVPARPSAPGHESDLGIR